MAQFDLKNATLKLQDGTTPTPLEITLKIGEGNFTVSEKRAVEYTLDGGKIDEVRLGDEEPMEISMDGTWVTAKGIPTSASVVTEASATTVSSTTITLAAAQPLAVVGSEFIDAGTRYTVTIASVSELTITPAVVTEIPASTTLTFEAAVITFEDALKNRKGALGWVSSDSDVCRPYALDLVLEYVACGGTGFETITYPDFRYEQIDYDASAGTVSFSGKCNVLEPVVAL